jgi:hypothetical protein
MENEVKRGTKYRKNINDPIVHNHGDDDGVVVGGGGVVAFGVVGVVGVMGVVGIVVGGKGNDVIFEITGMDNSVVGVRTEVGGERGVGVEGGVGTELQMRGVVAAESDEKEEEEEK